MKTIHYYRVSTQQQGRSGLGLEAQRHAVSTFCAARRCDMLAEYTEIESGKLDERPELAKALHHAKVTGATIVIAKLDRLTRDIAFLTALQKAGTKFVCVDMPEANELTIHIMAAVAQAERKMISKRTAEGLQAAKARGIKLGNPNGARALRRAQKGNIAAIVSITARADAHARDLASIITDIRATGVTTLAGIAAALNERTISTPRGGRWHATSVKNLLARIEP